MDDWPTITLTARGPDRWKLVTPEHRGATLDDAAVIDSGLASGDPWTPAVQERVRRAIADAGARMAAARLLRVRPRSSGELRQRLAGRYPGAAIERTIEGLVRSGAIDDARLAGELAEQFGSLRPHAREAVRHRLERAGLGDQMLEEALEAHAPSVAEGERAMQAARDQLGRLRALDLAPEAMRRRLYGVLARRGFDAEVAAETVERVLAAAEDAQD